LSDLVGWSLAALAVAYAALGWARRRRAPAGPDPRRAAGAAADARMRRRRWLLWLAMAAATLLYLHTASRSLRSPGHYAAAHWLLSYEFGFVKRGLLGELARPLFVDKDPAQIEQILAWLGAAVFFALSAVLLGAAFALLRRWLALRGDPALGAGVAVFLSSPFVVMSAHLVGYYDHLLAIATFAAIALLRRGALAAVAALSVGMLLVHELWLLYGLPIVVFALLLETADDCAARDAPLLPSAAARGAYVLAPTLLVFLAIHLQQGALPLATLEAIRDRLASYRVIPERFLDVFGVYHLRNGFLDAFEREHAFFWRRLGDPGLLRLVLPSAGLLLVGAVAHLWVAGRRRLVAPLLLLAASPLALHAVAWDEVRNASLVIFHGFAALFAVARPGAPRPGRRGSRILVLLSLPVVWANLQTPVELMDDQVDGRGLFSRSAPPDPALAARPNLVLLIVDTLRADRLASYGFPEPTSPELDALAREGVRFEHVIAQTSWTRPSIGSLLTSQHPRSLGLYHERRDRLPERAETLAEVLQRAGYTTLGATANPNVNASFGFAQGFDHYVDSDVLFPFMPEATRENTLLDRHFESADDLFAALLAQVDARRGPFFLQATVMEVHQFGALPEHAWRGAFAQASDPLYAEAVRLSSSQLGRFVAALREHPAFANTLFAIVSDHGHGLGDHPFVASRSRRSREAAEGHGWLLYESQVRVPFLLLHTGDALPRGLAIQQPVRLLDLMPTLLDLAGVPAPPDLAGRSLRGLWDASLPEPELPAHFVVETQFRGGDAIAVYGRHWKYFEHRKPIDGVAPRELQRRGGGEDGSRTDQLERFPRAAANLADVLARWEARYPRVRPTPRQTPMPESELRQLRALGYLEE
jgi:arylsulfatase A-like enzyme